MTEGKNPHTEKILCIFSTIFNGNVRTIFLCFTCRISLCLLVPCSYQLPGPGTVILLPWRVNAVSAAPPLLTHTPLTPKAPPLSEKKSRETCYTLYVLLHHFCFCLFHTAAEDTKNGSIHILAIP